MSVVVPGGFQEFGQALLDAVGEYAGTGFVAKSPVTPNVTLPQHMKIETPMQSVVAVRRARLSKR